MPIDAELSFTEGVEPFPNAHVFYVEYVDALNEPFAVTVGLTTTDPVDPRALLGARVALSLVGEPWLNKISGVVVAFKQRSAPGLAHGAAAYELEIKPALALLARRTARRIHQNTDVLGAIEATLKALVGVVVPLRLRIARPLPKREVLVQYDETDLTFVRRLLAEEHLISFFDPTADHEWIIGDDLTAAALPLPTHLVYRPPTGLVSSAPHALSLATSDALAEARVSLRDYNFEHPLLVRYAPSALDGQDAVEPAPREEGHHESFRVGRLTKAEDPNWVASRELDAFRSGDHTIACTTNFAMTAGTRFILLDHPRADLGQDFVVVASRMVLEDGMARDATPSGVVGRRYETVCVRSGQPYFSEPIARPTLAGTESAFVVGDGADGTVEVDGYGRVKIEFPWDRRDLRKGNPTRWVRVSQAWAGSNLGIVTLPRIGDEVLISYLGGDPDEPIVTGRAHNALSQTPLTLPQPDKTLSIWRSRTIGGDGYNEILMDDAKGGERLWLRAERHHKLHVKGSSDVLIDGDSNVNVGGKCTVHVGEELSVTSKSFSQETGLHETRTRQTKHTARDLMRLESDTIEIEGTSKVRISCGGSEIVLTPGGITISSGSVTIEAGEIKIAAQGTTDIDGALITLN